MEAAGLASASEPTAGAGNGPIRLTGGLGDYVETLPGTLMWKAPEGVPWPILSLLDPLGVAVRTVSMARTAPDAWDSVLTADSTAVIQGAGAVGLLTAVIARELGVGQVVLLGSRPSRLSVAERLGVADAVVDIRKVDEAERLSLVKGMTGGRGADLVIGCTNSPAALRESLDLVRRMGTVIEAGNMVNDGSNIAIDPAVDICQKNIRLLGMSLNPPRSFAEAVSLLGSWERLGLDQIISHVLPRSGVEDAFAAAQRSETVKVVLADAE